MFFYIKITADEGSGQEITMDGRDKAEKSIAGEIKEVKVFIDTVNENSSERASDILNKVEIKLAITENTNKICKDLMAWALEASGEDIYRNVRIDIRNEKGVIRSFDLSHMFVEDYYEVYEKGKSDNDAGEFTLKLIQKANKSKEFKQSSNLL